LKTIIIFVAGLLSAQFIQAQIASMARAGLNAVTSAFANMSYTTTRDLWAHSGLGTLASGYTTASLPAHACAMVAP
jgi:hypothetical protein